MAAEVGQQAPEFELFDQNKQPTKLSDSKGKNVVLAFYPGAFTGVCTTEMCTFRDRFDAFNSMNAQVYGVSVDGIFAQKAFSDANNLNFPLLSDFAESWRAKSLRSRPNRRLCHWLCRSSRRDG